MSNTTKIHSGKTPPRQNFIAEWAEKRNLRPVDIVNETGADKGLVSRWLNKGTLPKQEYLEKLAALFHTDVPGLFRHPDDDWLTKFFQDKTEEQRDMAIKVLQAMFEKQKTGTDS